MTQTTEILNNLNTAQLESLIADANAALKKSKENDAKMASFHQHIMPLQTAIAEIAPLKDTDIQTVNAHLCDLAQLVQTALAYVHFLTRETRTTFSMEIDGYTYTNSGYGFDFDEVWQGSSC